MAPAAPALAPATDLAVDPWREQQLTWLGSLLDRAALQGMRLAFDRLIEPPADELPAVRVSARPYLADELQENPRAFFTFLDEPAPPTTMTIEPRRRLAGGEAVCRRFATRYEPYHPAGCGACPENDVVEVEHWMHRSTPPHATVIALHGFGMGQPWIDAHVLAAARWYALGLDVALLTLPFHGCRSPRTARFSGELFASWHVGRLNEAVRQAVHDIHLVRAWLTLNSEAPVGLLGLSLGGYLAALFAGLVADLAFVVPVVPPVCLWDLPARLYRLGGSDALPLPRAELERAYRLHSPLTHPLAVPRERALIVGARGDLVVPPPHATALWHHWGEPPIHWISGSHTAPFRRTRFMERVAQHLRALDLLP